MALTDFINFSTIQTVSGPVSVSVNGQTLNVYKCIIPNLEKMVLPSPNSGASFQGVAVLCNSLGDVGLFILVAANPTISASGGMAAREVWLASGSGAFWLSELKSSALVTQSTVLTAPTANQQIGFRPITGSAPQNLNSITPSGASGGCVSATLIDQGVMSYSEDLIKLLTRLTTVETKLALIDPSILLASGHSVVNNNILSVSSALVAGSSAGKYIAYGNDYENLSPVYAALNQRSIARLELLRDGTLFANYENSASGSIDSDYQCAALPFASSPSWTRNTAGAPTESLSSDMLSIASPASSTNWYSRGTVGSLVNGAFLRNDIHSLTLLSGTYWDIEIDGGPGSVRDVLRLWGQGSVIVAQLLSKYTAYSNTIFGTVLNPSEPFSVGLMVSSSRSEMWINGQLADFSTPTATSGTNRFGWGFNASTAGGARSASVSRVVSKNGTTTPIGFASQSGPVVGHVVTTTATASKTIGLQGFDLDRFLGTRREGAFAFLGDFYYRKEGVGRVFFDGSIEPPDDGLSFDLAVSRQLYKILFGEVGTSFGAGDGSTTFNTPQGGGRFLIASNGTYSAYSTGGVSTNSLALANNAPHTHTQSIYTAISAGEPWGGIGPFVNAWSGVNSAATGSSGSGSAFSNIPPYLSIPAYIKWR